MRKIYIKLASSVLSVLMALTLVIGVSYAWVTLSSSPMVSGIQATIGGGNTIRLAPDLTQTVQDENGNTVVVHYPGEFDDTLCFSQHESYAYLKELSALSPVSTADGVHWILPAYDEKTGKLLDFDAFTVDSKLDYGNQAEHGKYVYLDFWVVSPGSEYELRVSTDVKTDLGSFLMELPTAQNNDSGELSLVYPQDHASTIARVGFLTNQQVGSTAGMKAYMESEQYNKRYEKLLGVFQERGTPADTTVSQQFTIYEPNGTLHPALVGQEGNYLVTRPLQYDSSILSIVETDISDRLTVQQSSSWSMLQGERRLDQMFLASIAGKQDLTADEATGQFYQEYLDGQVGPFVTTGHFFTSTAALYEQAAQNNGAVPAGQLEQSLSAAGATEDVIITQLQRDTPQRIRMFIWMEGQDADCFNVGSIPASAFSLGLELSGATK